VCKHAQAGGRRNSSKLGRADGWPQLKPKTAGVEWVSELFEYTSLVHQQFIVSLDILKRVQRLSRLEMAKPAE
jgi:hypothetical protein